MAGGCCGAACVVEILQTVLRVSKDPCRSHKVLTIWYLVIYWRIMICLVYQCLRQCSNVVFTFLFFALKVFWSFSDSVHFIHYVSVILYFFHLFYLMFSLVLSCYSGWVAWWCSDTVSVTDVINVSKKILKKTLKYTFFVPKIKKTFVNVIKNVTLFFTCFWCRAYWLNHWRRLNNSDIMVLHHWVWYNTKIK